MESPVKTYLRLSYTTANGIAEPQYMLKTNPTTMEFEMMVRWEFLSPDLQIEE